MNRLIVLLCLLLLCPVFAEEMPDHDIVLFDLVQDGDRYRLENPLTIAAEVGYENQPSFDGSSVLFTRMEKETADIWRWTPHQKAQPLVKTSLSEFSPTVMPSGGGISTVRVEKDGTQRLWRYTPDLGFRVIFESVKPVGYQAWSGDNVGLFVLGEPHRFEVARLGQTGTKVVAYDIGRCLQKVPGRDAISFTLVEGERHRLACYDFVAEKTKSLLLLPSQDYVWLDGETVLSSDGSSLLMAHVDGESWETVYSGKFKGISRLALSPDRRRLAVVFVKS